MCRQKRNHTAAVRLMLTDSVHRCLLSFNHISGIHGWFLYDSKGLENSSLWIYDYETKEKEMNRKSQRKRKFLQGTIICYRHAIPKFLVWMWNREGFLVLLLCRGFFSFISTVSVHQRSYYYRLEENPLKWLCEIALETISFSCSSGFLGFINRKWKKKI